MKAWRSVALLAPLVLAGCWGPTEAPLWAVPVPPPSLFDPLAYDAPAAPRLAFELQDGLLQSQFARQGPSAAHLLARSGASPRVIAAFPAGNAGIGIWFRPSSAESELSIGALAPLTRFGGEHPLHGVRATLSSSARQLTSELVLLGSVRTLRDYAAGECLEDAARFPALRNEGFELDPVHGGLRVRRVEIGGKFSMELLLAGLSGTSIALRERAPSPRPGCARAGGQPAIEITGGQGGIVLSLIALTSDEPLEPLEPSELLSRPPADARELSPLAFLAYRDKLLAGSWRFLTYFGRDTLLSLWMLWPELTPEAALLALGSVLERVLLEPGAAPGGLALERGDVAHEEEIGDYAAWKNQALQPPPGDLRAPRYDYGMIDDDLLLAPLLARLAEPGAAGRGEPETRSLEALLARRRGDGRSFEEAALENLGLVLRRARPFADDPRPAAEKKALLVSLREGSSVGQWRDSAMGLGFGRYPFDVNAALVPAALAAARTLYARLGRVAEAAEAERLARAWRDVGELFRFELPLAAARANVASYAASMGLADASGALVDDGGGRVVEYALALDAAGAPLPVQHTDHAFSLALGRPSQAYLRHVAARITRPFPAGLMSSAGVLVANPALAAPDVSVLDPRPRPGHPEGGPTPLGGLFTPAHYHGTVVWSWQQALLAAGLRRQLGRRDLAPSTRAELTRAECELWRAIDATRAEQGRELWSWSARDGRAEPRPFGASAGDADEANPIQLWSSVYLAVRKPGACGAPARRAQQ